ncbi:MAG: DOMON domain-containing protein [Promethearchaeota archaeon]
MQYETSVPLNNESQVVIDGSITTGEYEGTYFEPTTQMMVYWEHDENNLSVGLVSPGLGWASMGIGEHKFGANIIFGGSNDGSAYCYDQTGQPDYSHPNDTTLGGTNDIINFEAVENVTHTTLEFIIPLNSTDSFDPVMQVGETIGMFFAYHATSDDTQQLGHIHSGYVTVLIRSAVTTIQTSINISAPSSVTQGENLTIKATLLDENQNPIENRTLEFFRLTEIQPFYLIINAVSSDNLGKASITYRNPDLSGNHTFGVRFTEVGINNTHVFERKEVSSTVIFIVEENGEEDPVKKFLFLVIEFSVWLTLAAIVCIYLFIIYNLIRITTNKSPSHTENEVAIKKENSK